MNKNIINDFFDSNTFAETNSYIISPSAENAEAGDGVITGYGSVDGRAIFAAFQDEEFLKGSIGISHAKKISSCIDMAIKAGSPFVLFINSAGARINEGLEVLSGYGKIFKSLSSAIGVIPTISVINGSCTGASSIIASMTDFSFICEGSYFAYSGKDSLSSTTLQDTKNLFNAKAASSLGKVCFSSENFNDCIIKVKELLEYLPDNCQADTLEYESNDDFNRPLSTSEFDTFKDYDVLDLIKQISDEGKFIELYSEFAKNAITCLAKVGNKSICIIANQPKVSNGELDTNSCNKISTVLAFCDKFNIPVVTLTNTSGFTVSVEEENNGLSSAGALLATSFANSDITKINIITGKAYGSSYIVMNGKNTGADIVYAWDKADISIITPEAGALLLYNQEIKSAADPVNARNEYIKEYRKLYSTPMHAAYKGLIDDIISPSETRARIISALYLFN